MKVNPSLLDIAQNLNLWSIGNGYTYNTEYGGNWYNFGMLNNSYQPVEANTTYTISYNVTKQQFIKYYDSSKDFLSDSGQFTSASKTFTTPNNCAYILVVCSGSSTGVNIMLNKGTSALAYMPYIQTGPDVNHKLSLGAFDEIISVSTNIYTIKRQTGFCNVGKRLMEMQLAGDKNMQRGQTGGGWRWGSDYHKIVTDEIVNIIDNEQAGSTGVVISTPNAIIHSPIKFYFCTNNSLWSRGDINGIAPNFISLNAEGKGSGADDFFDFFTLNDIIIEYKASSYYTETITIS